jgi:hypothetical protein
MPSSRAFAAEDLLFGVECEFTEPATASVDSGLIGRYRAAVQRRCGAGRRGWFAGLLRCGIDVACPRTGRTTRLFPHPDQNVLEIATEPLSLEAFRGCEWLLQEVVWEAARDVGLVPGTDEINRWSMHVNVSWPTLAAGADGELLLRYVVDFNNHPELALGGCGGDIRNAPPLAILGPRPRRALRDLVDEWACGRRRRDAFAVARQLRRRVYHERFIYGSAFHNDFYHAINVCHVRRSSPRKRPYRVANPARVEIRSSFMAPSAAHLLSALEIVAGRLAFLSRQSTPIVCDWPVLAEPAGGRVFRTRDVQDGVTAEGVAACWIRYLREAGLDPLRHAEFLVHPAVRAAAVRLLPGGESVAAV